MSQPPENTVTYKQDRGKCSHPATNTKMSRADALSVPQELQEQRPNAVFDIQLHKTVLLVPKPSSTHCTYLIQKLYRSKMQ